MNTAPLSAKPLKNGEGPRRGVNVSAMPMKVVTESHIGKRAADRLLLTRRRRVRIGDAAGALERPALSVTLAYAKTEPIAASIDPK
ncbi:MAG TPA: hypothetical protein VED24_02115, partial [Candidatus Acidoferrum sp.]|nr:hypothetical protein [Candidatus Acidoferrum sp.]